MILTKIVSQRIHFFVKNKIKFFALSSILNLIIKEQKQVRNQLGTPGDTDFWGSPNLHL